VRGLLGDIEAAEKADKRGENAARIGTIERLDLFSYSYADFITHDWVCSRRKDYASNTITGRTSIEPVRAEGMRDATCMASFRSLALIM